MIIVCLLVVSLTRRGGRGLWDTFMFQAVIKSLIIICLLVVSLTRRGGRGLWDTFMFQAVIKSRARVPAHDSFIAKRIAGPGLASNYFLQVRFITILALPTGVVCLNLCKQFGPRSGLTKCRV